MKSLILSESATRREYKRRWKALERARNNGLDTDLINKFYVAMIKKGYTQETMRAVIYCAGRDGVFGLSKNKKGAKNDSTRYKEKSKWTHKRNKRIQK